MTPRLMIRFRHVDAVVKPKLRPATVAGAPVSGRSPLFYGSTFKRTGHPRHAIIIDPRAPASDDARDLAEH